MTNLVLNPTFETDVSNWAAYYTTLTRDTTQFHSGVASMKMVAQYTTAVGAYSNTLAMTVGQSYRASLWVKGTGGFQFGFYGTVSGTWYLTGPVYTLSGVWQNFTLDWVATATDAVLFPTIGTAGQTVNLDDISVDLTPVAPPSSGLVVMRGGARVVTADSLVLDGVKKTVTSRVIRH